MLSSESYVCLGMCTGMCVIGRGINLGGQVLPFILFVLFQRSCYFDVLLCVFFLLLFCGCFQFYHVVRSSGCCSPEIWCFALPCKFSPGCCVGQQSTQYFIQVFLFLQQMEVLGPRTWHDTFSCLCSQSTLLGCLYHPPEATTFLNCMYDLLKCRKFLSC